jgi:hypothetical protein
MTPSEHFEIVDSQGRCATPFAFSSASDACDHLAGLQSDNLAVASVTITVERKVRLLGSVFRG